MDTQASPSHLWQKVGFWIVTCAFLGGLILSIVSFLEICTGSCNDLKFYRLFGLPFAYFGIPLFTALLGMQLFKNSYAFLTPLIAATVAGALGAEAYFIWIQYKIGVWCPVCLSIAALVVIAAITLILNSWIQNKQKGQAMQTLKHFFTVLPVSVIGLFAALFGISKPDQNLIAMNSMQEKLEFGNKASPIEVYFVTDWFCVVCRQVEPLVNKLAPKIMQQAGFYYIDKPVHRETENYSPYNLAFMVSDKARYIQVRDSLSKLTLKNKTPSDEAIQQAVAKTGAKLNELSYGDVKAGLSFFDETVKKYKVWGTPTLVVVNTKTNKMRQLSGEEDFTEANIMNALKEVQK